MNAPESEAELCRRARALAGRTVFEVAEKLAVPVPSDQRRAKGFVGTLVERALGATAATRSAPDFEALGVELKTIPVRRDGRPRESTFVCVIPLARIAELEWETSPVRAKLARVLFVPVEAEPDLALGARRLGSPALWSPSRADDSVLRADWEELAGLIGAGHVEAVTGHLGRALQVRPKAASSRDRRRAPDADGAWLATVPRGFYLRATFTAEVLGRFF